MSQVGYQCFNHEIQSVIRRISKGEDVEPEVIQGYLNGAAALALEANFSKEERSRHGVFFSGKKLSAIVANKISHLLKSGATVADPACGAGDLLMACMTFFGRSSSIEGTLDRWGARIFGTDREPSFVETARYRLALAAVSSFKIRNALQNEVPLSDAFLNVRSADFLKEDIGMGDVDCLVMNPPFRRVSDHSGVSWAEGQVELAGIFLDKVVRQARAGQEIVAVLPDVLRSGSRYQKFRAKISADCSTKSAETYGRFDAKTNVDVFVLHLVKLRRRRTNAAPFDSKLAPELSSSTVGEAFHVSIGPVVPHRSPETGPSVPYLTVSSAPRCGYASKLPVRKFSGRLVSPPFLVVRRSSSPNDGIRVVPTVVGGLAPVAVENHLIVLEPKMGGMRACVEAMRVLAGRPTSRWVDLSIRCRHLTKGVVERIPFALGEE